jgi:FAD binding domain
VPGARIREVVNRGAFRIHRRMADRFRVGRVLLAGDAAHVCSPSAGVGMNAGMQDSANLAWKLGLVVAGRAAPSLLDTYEEERKAADMAAMSRSHAAQTDMLVADAVHDRALAVHPARPTAQMLETEAGVELQIHYRASSIVAGVRDGTRVPADSWPAGPVPGDRVPDAGPLVTGAGKQRSLRDMLRGPRQTAARAGWRRRRREPAALHRSHHPGHGPLRRPGRRIPRRHRGRAAAGNRGPGRPGRPNPRRARPPGGRRGHRPSRPPRRVRGGYVASRGEPPDPAALEAYLGELFTGAR